MDTEDQEAKEIISSRQKRRLQRFASKESIPSSTQSKARRASQYSVRPSVVGLQNALNTFNFLQKKNDILADDDLESQMDDYMIESHSSMSDSEPSQEEIFQSENSQSSKDDCESSDSYHGDSFLNLQQQVLQEMENFYDENYETRHILTIDDIFHERVFSTFYDTKSDLLYLFVGKINQIKGNKYTNLTKLFGFTPKEADKNIQQFDYEHNQQAISEYKKLTVGEKALQFFLNCTVGFELRLQVWNIDDRIVRDLNHRQRPIATFQCCTEKIQIDPPMNTFGHMNFIQNIYQDFAYILQNDSQIHFFTGNKNLQTYDTALKNTFNINLRINEDTCNKVHTFRSVLHYRDIGTVAQAIESIIQVRYYHQDGQKCQKEAHDEEDMDFLSDRATSKQVKQSLILRTINYKSISDCKYLTDEKEKYVKVKDNVITLKDDALTRYYQNKEGRKIKPFFIQRLLDTSTYLIIFPTGLLLLMNIYPFNILAKISLNLQPTETIVDFQYCISQSSKNHCVWMLDEKNQVWKCQNEMNINSVNWNLTKVEMFDHLFYKKFFTPSMTFHNFQTMTSLNKLKPLADLNSKDIEGQNEYIVAFNETTTRSIIVKQPLCENIGVQEQDLDEGETQNNTLQQMLRKKLSISNKQLVQTKIVVTLLCKRQNIIINKIPQKQTILANIQESMGFLVTKKIADVKKKSYLQQQKSFVGGADDLLNRRLTQNDPFEKIREKMQEDNEVYELAFLRKSFDKDSRKNSQPKTVIEFLVRRKRSLEIMKTNGLNFTTTYITNSLVNAPIHISDSILSQNKKTIIAYYSVEGDDSQVSVKCFELNSDGEYKQKDTNTFAEVKNCKNVYLDHDGNIQEIKIQISRNQKSMKSPLENIIVDRTGQVLDLRIPAPIFYEGLFDCHNELNRVILSDNQRVLMCGKVLIQLSSDLEDVQRIGCIINRKDNSHNVKYHFLSLKDDRKEIKKILSDQPEIFVHFSLELPPVSPKSRPDIMFFTNCFDGKTGDTSVVKIDTHSLDCIEIYQSNFKIVHMALLDFDQCTASNQKDDAIAVTHEKLWRGLGKMKTTTNQELQKDIHDINAQSKKKRKVYLSLISQSKNYANVEVISHQECKFTSDTQKTPAEDENQDGSDVCSELSCDLEETGKQKPLMKGRVLKQKTLKDKISNKLHKVGDHGPIVKCSLQNRALLVLFLNISTKENLRLMSEIGWINKNQMVITLNNDFYLVNMNHTDLRKTKNGVMYGIQQVNMGLFCSLVKMNNKVYQKNFHNCKNSEADIDIEILNQTKTQKTLSSMIVSSQKSVQRMEIASLRKYSQICTTNKSDINQMSLLFFTPAEELSGGNIFSKVSNKFSVMQPYLDKIDSDFINLMNMKVQNIALYVNPNYQVVNNFRIKIQKEENLSIIQKQDNNEMFQQTQGIIHMYQDDISGQNVIDYAFKKNAIFCIKAFVDTLLVLTEEKQFRNCIDKALLLMINRGMDVKELVNSELFYPHIWQNLTLFSPCEEMVIIPHSGELDDLEFQDPNLLFSTAGIMDQNFDEQNASLEEKILMNSRNIMSGQDRKDTNIQDQYEMQYNYIYMKEIEEADKMSVSQALKDCKDIKLFEQEAIKVIIDYKWETYGKSFFLLKFFIYTLFLLCYYIDLESIHADPDMRIKGLQFMFCKTVCTTIQTIFLIYEIMQIKKESESYWLDPWNYLELLGMILFYWAAFLDVTSYQVNDTMRILFCLSIMMSLVKIVYLVRVFKSLNFLVTMLAHVCNEVIYFMMLFGIFLLTFAECNHIVQVSIKSYGRIPGLIAHLITILRCSMGDFSLLESDSTFDIKDENAEYVHSHLIVGFTWFIYVVSVFYLFMIFMNFIIAVIGDSYNAVIENKDSHDYQQRIVMIYEREVHFNQKQFEDKRNFPDILIVRKKKDTDGIALKSNNWQGMMTVFKGYMKTQTQYCVETIHQKSKEQKQHFTNSIIHLENDISNINKDIEKMTKQLRQLIFWNKGKMSKDSNSLGLSQFGASNQRRHSVDISKSDQDTVSQKLTESPNVANRQPSSIQMGGVSHITSPAAAANVNNQNRLEERDRMQSELPHLIEEPEMIPQRQSSHHLNIGDRQNHLNIRDDQNQQYISDARRTLPETIVPQNDQLQSLKSFINRKFENMDERMDKLDNQMKTLMQIQMQNQEMIKHQAISQQIIHQETGAQIKSTEIMFKQTQREIALVRNDMQMMSPLNVGNNGRESAMSMPVSTSNAQFGNLPMSRAISPYPEPPKAMNNFTSKRYSSMGSEPARTKYKSKSKSKKPMKKRQVQIITQSDASLAQPNSNRTFKSSKLSN